MTKEELMKKLEFRTAKKAEEKAKREQEEKELYVKQLSRLNGLVDDMKTDIELEHMMRANKIVNANFCWDGNSRHGGLGFEVFADNDKPEDLKHIIVNLYVFGLTTEDMLVGFNPWEPEKGFKLMNEKGWFLKPYKPSTSFIEVFCDRFEGFHEDYHAWLSSNDWDTWDLDNKA